MHIEAKTHAMVDMCNKHFMSGGEAKKLGLKIEKDSNRIKEGNSKAQQVAGAAKDMNITIGMWNGRTSFMVIPLDVFKLYNA